MYRTDYFLALPEDVITLAWSAPMRELAQKIGISDVGLRNLLKSTRIPLPRQGHWNRVHAGSEVQSPPRPRPRGPGESGRIRLDDRFRSHVPEAERMQVEGPFASQYVPEDLEELLALELEAIGKVAVLRELGRLHRGLYRLLCSPSAPMAQISG